VPSRQVENVFCYVKMMIFKWCPLREPGYDQNGWHFFTVFPHNVILTITYISTAEVPSSVMMPVTDIYFAI
jgi:hypothetical protein